MPVDDPRPIQVVRRDLNPDAVAREDADTEAPHLAGHVAQDLVAVVELHPEHRVRERLDDLPFELDLFFLRQAAASSDQMYVGGLWPLRALAELVLDLRTLSERAEPVTLNGGEVDERILTAVVRGDEPEALLVAEPLHDTGSQSQHLLTKISF